MKDLTLKRKEKSNFVTGYSFADNNMIVKYADESVSVLPFNMEVLEQVENKMKEQALDQKYIDDIDKKLGICNLVIAISTTTSVLSLAIAEGFAIAEKPTPAVISIGVLGGSAATDIYFAKKKKKLLELREEAEKYRIIAENLDLYNDTYCHDFNARPMTMNDAESFDYKSIKSLVKTAKECQRN